MLALCSCLEDRKTPFDRELDRLVVAELKVQVAPLFGGAPVAAVERLALVEVERARDRPARTVASEDEQDAVAHRPKDLGEEGLVEVGNAPLSVERAKVESVHRSCVLAPQRLPRETFDLEAFASELAPLARDLATALAFKGVQVIGERIVATVVPMELQRMAHRKPTLRELLELPLG